MGFVKFSLVVVVLAVVLNHLLKREYPVPARGSVVLITGASSGIGRHACLALADRFTVYCGVRKESDVAALRAVSNGKVHPIILDVTNEKQMEDALAEIKATGLRFGGLVNNAGVASHFPVEFQEDAHHRWMFDVNYFGVVRLTQMFLPTLRADKGRVVTVGSIAGFLTFPGGTAYHGSKCVRLYTYVFPSISCIETPVSPAPPFVSLPAISSPARSVVLQVRHRKLQ